MYYSTNKYLLLGWLALLCWLGCGSNTSEVDAQFDIFENNYRNFYWSYHPEEAFDNGVYQYADLLMIPNNANRQAYLNSNREYKTALKRFNRSQLNEANKNAYDFVKAQIEKEQLKYSIEKSYEWNPAYIDLDTAFKQLMYSKHEPLANRLLTIAGKLKYLPPYFDAMKNNLQNPPPELTRIAIQQNTDLYKFLNTDYKYNVNRHARLNAKQKAAVNRQIQIASVAIDEYIKFCKECL